MATTDPNPPVTEVDTTAVTGATGPLPVGTQFVALDTDTTIFGGGGGEDPILAVEAATVDTSATNSANDPSKFVPVNTGIGGAEPDSTQGGGSLRVDANPAYRAPSGPVPVVEKDTSWTDSPVTGTVLVTNKAFVVATGIATIVTDGTYNFTVGEVAVLVNVDVNLDGTHTIVTVPTPGTFTFHTTKPLADIVSVAVVGGEVSVTTMANMSATLDSYNIGAVPVTTTAVPAAPTAVSAVANSGGTVTVSWTAPAVITGAPLRGYIVEGSRGYFQRVPANVTSHTTDAWTLEASAPTTFTVRAVNDNGSGPKSLVSGSVTPLNINFTDYAPGKFPDVTVDPTYSPTGNVDFFLVGAQTRNGVTYTWVLPPTDHAYSAGVLKVYDAATNVEVGGDHVLLGTDTTLAVTGLTYGHSYYATVAMTNSVGTVTSPAATTVVADLAPLAPTTVAGTDGGTHHASLTWVAPTDFGGSAITGYKIESSADGGTTWLLAVANTGSAAVSASVLMGAAGTYEFRISAINAIGTSPASVASAGVVLV